MRAYFPTTRFIEALLEHTTIMVVTREEQYCTCCSVQIKVNEEGHGFPIKELLDINICNKCWEDLTRHRNW